MHHDLPAASAARASGAPSRFGRVISSAFIVIAVGALAVYAEPDGTRSERSDSDIANLASSPSIASEAGVAGPSSPRPADAPRFQRTDEPAYSDATNPHGG